MPLPFVQEVGIRENASYKDPSATVTYLVWRTDDEEEARLAALAFAPDFYWGLFKLGQSLEHLGGGVWKAEVTYGLDKTALQAPAPPQSGGNTGTAHPAPGDEDPLDESYQFSTQAEVQHITQCITRISETSAGDTDPIDVTPLDKTIGRDGTGADRYGSVFKWSRTQTFPSISRRYMKTLRDLTATVNDATFYGRPRGEVLFLGADGAGRNAASACTITFHFAESRNLTLEDDPDELTFCNDSGADPDHDGVLTVPAKEGWQHLWVSYRPFQRNSMIVQVPATVYVDQIYRYGDFSKLKIGV